MITIPHQFAQTMLNLYAERGRAWLDALPALVAECAERWSLEIQPPFPYLSYNYVLPATAADGQEVVLKLGVPHEELTTEIDALRIFDGRGIAQLFFGDAERGILLLERLRPGEMLLTLTDDGHATEIAADVMQTLWQPAPAHHRFQVVWDLVDEMRATLDAFPNGIGPFPRPIVERARRLAQELAAAPHEEMLLHGDFQHFNVLTASRAPWLAIDPKGRVGERGFEVGALLLNPDLDHFNAAELKSLLARRIAILAERLGLPRERLLAWGIVFAMISACWSHDMRDEWQTTMMCANVLAEIMEPSSP